jgi:hypothetical protein
LRVGIARGRSYTSVLIIPRRKTSLCEAPNGRRPWPDLEAPCELIGAHRRGEGDEGQGQGALGAAMRYRGLLGEGGHGVLQGLVRCCSFVLCVGLLCSVREGNSRERKEKERRRKERRKRKKEGKEKKKYEKNFKLENFRKIKDNL